MYKSNKDIEKEVRRRIVWNSTLAEGRGSSSKHRRSTAEERWKKQWRGSEAGEERRRLSTVRDSYVSTGRGSYLPSSSEIFKKFVSPYSEISTPSDDSQQIRKGEQAMRDAKSLKSRQLTQIQGNGKREKATAAHHKDKEETTDKLPHKRTVHRNHRAQQVSCMNLRKIRKMYEIPRCTTSQPSSGEQQRSGSSKQSSLSSRSSRRLKKYTLYRRRTPAERSTARSGKQEMHPYTICSTGKYSTMQTTTSDSDEIDVSKRIIKNHHGHIESTLEPFNNRFTRVYYLIARALREGIAYGQNQGEFADMDAIKKKLLQSVYFKGTEDGITEFRESCQRIKPKTEIAKEEVSIKEIPTEASESSNSLDSQEGDEECPPPTIKSSIEVNQEEAIMNTLIKDEQFIHTCCLQLKKLEKHEILNKVRRAGDDLSYIPPLLELREKLVTSQRPVSVETNEIQKRTTQPQPRMKASKVVFHKESKMKEVSKIQEPCSDIIAREIIAKRWKKRAFPTTRKHKRLRDLKSELEEPSGPAIPKVDSFLKWLLGDTPSNILPEDGYYDWEFELPEREFVPRPVAFPGGSQKAMAGFKEDLDPGTILKFEEMRRDSGEDTVVTIQDLKEVAIFTAKFDIPLIFIRTLHSPLYDRFLRSILIYMQYFNQVWHALLNRKAIRQQKIWHPRSDSLSKIWRVNLDTYRYFAARDYFALISSEEAGLININYKRECALFELFTMFTVRSVQIGLFERDNHILEREFLRLISQRTKFNDTEEFLGALHPSDRGIIISEFDAFHTECKSPILRELSRPNRDYPFDLPKSFHLHLLGKERIIRPTTEKKGDYDKEMMVGDEEEQAEEEDEEEDLLLMQYALMLNEKDFREANVRIGILGFSRDLFDPLLRQSPTEEKFQAPNAYGDEELFWIKENRIHHPNYYLQKWNKSEDYLFGLPWPLERDLDHSALLSRMHFWLPRAKIANKVKD